jgi:hypothetical protein
MDRSPPTTRPGFRRAGSGCTDAAAARSHLINCLDDGSVTAAIQALGAAGVVTIVVGVPGSGAFVDYLNAFAEAAGELRTGGSTYYAATDSAGVAGLAETLHDITIDLVKNCVITYTMPPRDPEGVVVLADCNLVPREPLDGGDGSYWTLDQAAKTITLGGPICDRIRNEGVERLDYLFCSGLRI